MIKLMHAGVIGRAASPTKKAIVPIEYRYRMIELEKSGVTVPDVLVGVDIDTGEVLTIPAQSMPKIKEARDAVKTETKQVYIPLVLDDVARLIAARFEGVHPRKFVHALVRYYLNEAVAHDDAVDRYVKAAKNQLVHSQPTRRESFAWTVPFVEKVNAIVDKHPGLTFPDFVKSTYVLAKQDILDRGVKKRIHDLETVAGVI